jgi:hypothetical protein
METTPDKGKTTKTELGPLFLGGVTILAILGIMTVEVIKAILSFLPILFLFGFIWVAGTAISAVKRKDKE